MSCANYIARAKVKLGDRRMSDRELGELLAKRAKRPEGPYSQASIAQSKSGKCTDPIAIALERVLIGDVAVGEILLVARAEREKDQVVKERLLTFAKNVLGRLPEKVTGAIVALVMAIGLLLHPDQASAAEAVGLEPSPA